MSKLLLRVGKKNKYIKRFPFLKEVLKIQLNKSFNTQHYKRRNDSYVLFEIKNINEVISSTKI